MTFIKTRICSSKATIRIRIIGRTNSTLNSKMSLLHMCIRTMSINMVYTFFNVFSILHISRISSVVGSIINVTAEWAKMSYINNSTANSSVYRMVLLKQLHLENDGYVKKN